MDGPAAKLFKSTYQQVSIAVKTMASNLAPKPSIAMDHTDSMAEGDVDYLEVPGVNTETQLKSLRLWSRSILKADSEQQAGGLCTKLR